VSSEFDAIVIGSGVTGGWAAKELCENGLKTLVIERGRYIEHGGPEYTDFIPPWQSRYYGWPPESFGAQNPRLARASTQLNPDNLNWFVKDDEQPYSTPDGRPYLWVRSYHLGGRSLHWLRVSHRMGAFHFRSHAKDGHGVAWPIGYDDLASWYDHVEAFAGVAGSVEGLDALPDGKFQPPFALNCAEQTFKERVEAAFPGRKVIPARTANLTAPTDEQQVLGRSQCQARNYCHKGCHFGAYFSSLSATLPAAKRTGNLTIVTDMIGHSVIYDPHTRRATGVRAIDAHTKAGREYKARMVFLCAGAIPTTQILMLSVSESFPHGLGNRSGALGRYLMGPGMGCAGFATVPGHQDRYYYGRKPAFFIIPAYRNVTEAGNGYVRTFSVLGTAYRPSWERGASGPGIGRPLKEALRAPGQWKMSLVTEGEMLPRWENRITLHPTKTDRWGMPLVHIDVGYSENERRMTAQAKQDIRRMLETAGCLDITISDTGSPGGALCDTGTAVMGSDPATSVLNGWNGAHDVPNVFVTDGACMPSNGDPNSPTLTFMALTARAANYAAELAREGKL
jgi:choline dehydrogenase-like flavoprotein